MGGVVTTANKLKLAVEKVIYLLAFGTTGCVHHARVEKHRKHVRNHSCLVRPKQNHSSHILQKPARNVGNNIVCIASKQAT